jgi:hypothetical protein
MWVSNEGHCRYFSYCAAKSWGTQNSWEVCAIVSHLAVPQNPTMNDLILSENVVRDLMQCVQWAREHAHADTAFRPQCDTALARATSVGKHSLPHRSSTIAKRVPLAYPDTIRFIR